MCHRVVAEMSMSGLTKAVCPIMRHTITSDLRKISWLCIPWYCVFLLMVIPYLQRQCIRERVGRHSMELQGKFNERSRITLIALDVARSRTRYMNMGQVLSIPT